jgi:hypothetical protein
LMFNSKLTTNGALKLVHTKLKLKRYAPYL